MLPEFDSDGDLAPGIHDASLDELGHRFGRFVASDRRVRLFAKLSQLIHLCRSSGAVRRLLVGGSFVTAKSNPNDVDIVLVLASTLDLDDPTSIEHTVSDRDALRRTFTSDLDVIVVRERTGPAKTAIEFFQTNRDNKEVGVVEVVL